MKKILIIGAVILCIGLLASSISALRPRTTPGTEAEETTPAVTEPPVNPYSLEELKKGYTELASLDCSSSADFVIQNSSKDDYEYSFADGNLTVSCPTLDFIPYALKIRVGDFSGDISGATHALYAFDVFVTENSMIPLQWNLMFLIEGTKISLVDCGMEFDLVSNQWNTLVFVCERVYDTQVRFSFILNGELMTDSAASEYWCNNLYLESSGFHSLNGDITPLGTQSIAFDNFYIGIKNEV